MSTKTPTMRELMKLARERFGPAAARLKTREELLGALQGDAPRHAAPHHATPEPPAEPEKESPLVTRDFFRDPR